MKQRSTHVWVIMVSNCVRVSFLLRKLFSFYRVWDSAIILLAASHICHVDYRFVNLQMLLLWIMIKSAIIIKSFCLNCSRYLLLGLKRACVQLQTDVNPCRSILFLFLVWIINLNSFWVFPCNIFIHRIPHYRICSKFNTNRLLIVLVVHKLI